MNKNGFIATSLIYSFFLIFITLFLTIIADYLQDKVLLNTIEKGIKDELNSTMSIEDFEVGDMISFVKECTDEVNNQWVIANVNYVSKSIIFYSFDFDGLDGGTEFANGSEKLTKNYLNEDIEVGYKNTTYLNKILYTFEKKDESGNPLNDYCIKENEGICVQYVSINCSDASESERDYNFGNNCISASGTTSGTNSKFRKRLVKSIGNNSYDKCVTGNNGDGVIILDVLKDDTYE